MKTFLLNSGLSVLQEQSSSGITDGLSDKITFTGFDIGSGIGEIVDRNSTTVAGQLLYSGTEESMFVTPIHTNEVLISCEINKEILYMRPGNILLRVNADKKAFLIAISEHSMFKFQTSLSSVGTKLIFNIIINIPGLIDRFDLSNLGNKVATFKTFATDLDVTRWAWEEPVNQLFIDTDARIGKPAFVISSGRNYWSSPFIENYSHIQETWNTRYPWLDTLPVGDTPDRQANYTSNVFWIGWPNLTTNDKQGYLTKVNGYEDIEGNTVYNVTQDRGSVIVTAVSSINSFDMEVLWQMDSGIESNSLKIVRDPDDKNIKIYVYVDDVRIVDMPLGIVLDNLTFKVALSWADGIIIGCLNGGTAEQEYAEYTPYILEREGVNANNEEPWLGTTQYFTRYNTELSSEVLRLVSVMD